MVHQEAVQTTTVHITQVIDQLKSLGDVSTNDTLRSTLTAAQEAEVLWESLQEQYPASKTKKLLKVFNSHLDWSVKHSTGGANTGYSLILRHVRGYSF